MKPPMIFPMEMASMPNMDIFDVPMLSPGNASTTRGFNRLSQKAKRRRARQQRSQSFRKGGAK